MDWSTMLPELLDTIAQKFVAFYEDYNYFGGVCKSWHSAAMEAALEHPYSNGPPSRFPCLMLSEKTEDGESRELLLLSNKSIRKIRLPEVHGKLCMSSFGWLVTVGEDHATQLINPLSRETIDLPKIDTFPEFAEYSSWYHGISKLLFLNQSSSLAEAMVVVLWGDDHKLGFCRIGDNKWTHVETGWGGEMLDITFYNGKVYCFDGNYHIRVCDVYGESSPKLIDKVSRLPKDLYNDDLDGGYIVGMDDDDKRKRLLVVIREGMFDDLENVRSVETYKTKSFKVLEYDLENGKWSTVNDLGRKTLFVGYSSSFWVEDNTGVIEPNCIYYTDDVFEMYFQNQSGEGGRDMGIYRMSDGTIEPHFTGVSRSKLTPPIWLQSI